MASTSASAIGALLLLGATLVLVTDRSVFEGGADPQPQNLAMMTSSQLENFKKAQKAAKEGGFCKATVCTGAELAAWFTKKHALVASASSQSASVSADASTHELAMMTAAQIARFRKAQRAAKRAGFCKATACTAAELASWFEKDAEAKQAGFCKAEVCTAEELSTWSTKARAYDASASSQLAATQLSQSGMLAIVHAFQQMSLKTWGADAAIIAKNCPACQLCRNNATCSQMGDARPCAQCMECANCMFVHPAEWGTRDPQFDLKNAAPPPPPAGCANNVCAACPDCKDCVAKSKFTLSCAPCWKCRHCAPYWARCSPSAAATSAAATSAASTSAASSSAASTPAAVK